MQWFSENRKLLLIDGGMVMMHLYGYRRGHKDERHTRLYRSSKKAKSTHRQTADWVGDEVGRTALLLASDHTTAITGETLHVDDGFHIDGMIFH